MMSKKEEDKITKNSEKTLLYQLSTRGICVDHAVRISLQMLEVLT